MKDESTEKNLINIMMDKHKWRWTPCWDPYSRNPWSGGGWERIEYVSEITVGVGFLVVQVYNFSHEQFNMKEPFAEWMRRLLIVDQKRNSVTYSKGGGMDESTGLSSSSS